MKQRKFLELPNLKDDREHAAEFLFNLASIIETDDRINVAEAAFFKVICAKLGFPKFCLKGCPQVDAGTRKASLITE